MDKIATMQPFQALSLEERLELLYQLWDQLLDNGWKPVMDDELKPELDRRWANYMAQAFSSVSK